MKYSKGMFIEACMFFRVEGKTTSPIFNGLHSIKQIINSGGFMSFVSKVFGLARLGKRLRPFLQTPLTLEAAKAEIRRGMAIRDAAFLRTLERAVFSYPRSPYLKLFRYAGCELGDVRNLVTHNGLEEALRKLIEAGIYVTFEEFKGMRPARRGSEIFTFRNADFDNPLITRYYESSSGGTSGPPARISVDFDHITQSAPHWAVLFAEHNAVDAPLILWTPPHSGIANRYLMCAKFGKRFERWFTLLRLGTVRSRIKTTCVHTLIRYIGQFPKSVYVPIDAAATVAEYLLRLRDGGACPVINTSPSAAIRICQVVKESTATLEGVTFILGAEPVTAARKKAIEASGAKAVAVYGFSEGGGVGAQCRHASSADDVHIFMDAFAVIQRNSAYADKDHSDTLLFSSLRPACPKIMINTEIGDSAVFDSRPCDCLFGEAGYMLHLSHIRSLDKLTGEGMTVRAADIYPIIEDMLPRRFGGLPGHYQFVEKQGSNGLTQYRLLVSPEVGIVDEESVQKAFTQALRAMNKSYRHMVDLWSAAGSVSVVRRSPCATGRGKVLPFRILN